MKIKEICDKKNLTRDVYLKKKRFETRMFQPFVEICGALLYDHLPSLSGPGVCKNMTGSITRKYTQIEDDSMVLYVPYPRAGPWHILVQAICYKNDS